MYLFDLNKDELSKKREKCKNNVNKFQNRKGLNKKFRKQLGIILKDYLQGRISYLEYIKKLFELHKKFKRSGFSATDFAEEKRRFLRTLRSIA